ncbi:peptidase [Rhizorhabdus dicambivorans]|uniref:Peptidase n=1 Tax=Rhizorhabdus dicambivorans TaxID=1850238 RepID=A0A2A4FQA2_9SPHN|nr:peptidase [Rhizorhabdus dicambivorans]ATE64299.1 peptidase [Rhizorhabdus dicambivorans]PCE40935.1 peptidase [Rhizorhabdus dicambivorans]
MTYCVGIMLRQGLIMVADTRTNAGIDNISTYRKLHVLADTKDSLVVAASAGNLSVTQLVLGMLNEGLPSRNPDEGPRKIEHMPSMFQAAQLVGEAVMAAAAQLKPALYNAGVASGISLLLGGRIGGGPLKLFLIYDAGNFIECQPDSPYFQIGACQYGKPILDRAMTHDSTIDEAVKVALLSFDSTIRSDKSVGLPFDVMVFRNDPKLPIIKKRIEPQDPYMRNLSDRWSTLLNEGRAAIPDPPFLKEDGGVVELKTAG